MMETKNVKFVAFLRYNGIHPDQVNKISRGKAQYNFNMTKDEWDKHKQDFNRSEFIKYGQCIDAVLDLAY